MNRIITRGFGVDPLIVSRGYNAPAIVVILREVMRLASKISMGPMMLFSTIGRILNLNSGIDLEEIE